MVGTCLGLWEWKGKRVIIMSNSHEIIQIIIIIIRVQVRVGGAKGKRKLGGGRRAGFGLTSPSSAWSPPTEPSPLARVARAIPAIGPFFFIGLKLHPQSQQYSSNMNVTFFVETGRQVSR